MPNPRKKLLLIYTGGTIGMIQSEEGTYIPFDFELIDEQFPELHKLGCDIEVKSYSSPMDSSNIGPKEWIEIANAIHREYDNFDGFVIMHGSDTMAYTGSALSFMLEGLAKPVILTGAQLPINEIRTDAKENLITAIEIASHPEAPIREVGIYFEYKLFRANRTKKVHADVFSAFESPNFGPLVEAGVHLRYRHPTPKDATANSYFQVHPNLELNIGNARFYPGLTVESLGMILLNPKSKGVILQSYGTGNVPTNPEMIELMMESAKQDKVILNITQCNGGFVEMGRYATSKELVKSGVLGGADLTFEAALTKMMYLMGKYDDLDKVRYYMVRNIRGEMTAERAITN